MKTYLYKHYDKNRVLLYVGITSDLKKRHAHHRKNSRWFYQIHTFSSQSFDTRFEAECREMEIIADKQPLHNIQHKKNGDNALDPDVVLMKLNIKQAIRKSGKTQNQIAEELGITRSAVGFWQSPRETMLPVLARLPAVCRVLNVPIDSIFKGLDEEYAARVSGESSDTEKANAA